MVKISSHQVSGFHSKPGHITLALIGILLIASVLRFTQITQPFTDAFSWRETSVAMMAENYYRTNGNIFYPEVNWPGPGPNYQGREFQTVSYLASLLYPITGQQDWVGRSVAVLFGLWGIFALFHLVRRVWDDEHAVFSAAVMAVLPGSIIVDRSFLPDPVMVALVVTCVWMFVAYLQTEKMRYLILAALFGSWGFCTKIPGLIVGLPMAYAALVLLPGRQLFQPRRLFILASFAVVMLLPVAAYYLWARHLALSYPPFHFAGEGNWVWDDGIQKWISLDYFIPKLIKRLVEWMWGWPIIILMLLSFPMLLFPGSEDRFRITAPTSLQQVRRPIWIFSAWLLAGIIYYLIGAKEIVDNPWNLHILNPAIAALSGFTIVRISSLTSGLKHPEFSLPIKFLFLLFIGLAGISALRSVYHPYADQGYRLGMALREISRPGDLVVTIGTNYGDPVPIYYSRRRGWGFPPPTQEYSWMALPENDDISIEFFNNIRTSGAKWLGIVGQNRDELLKGHPILAEYIGETCELVRDDPQWMVYRVLNPTEVNQKKPQQKGTLSGMVSAQLSTQEIRYYLPGAEDVNLIWGVNGWNDIASALRPLNTAVIDRVMNTEMTQEGDTFSIKMRVPYGLKINFTFQVTRGKNGAEVNIWDKEYNLLTNDNHLMEIRPEISLP